MSKTVTLKLNKEFKRLYYRGKSAVRPSIVVYALPNKRPHNRIGITCGKAIGKAVKRNRVKRIIRVAYRLSEGDIKTGYDFVIVARTKSVFCKHTHIYNDFRKALDNMGLLRENDKVSD
ncbi:MAG: ribonuclease P protein component [Clostridia bacterium]|nr:ribonuclease P protein component [Clostridia bacterium]